MKSRFIREQKTICGKEYMEVDLLHVSPAEHRASVRRKKRSHPAWQCRTATNATPAVMARKRLCIPRSKL